MKWISNFIANLLLKLFNIKLPNHTVDPNDKVIVGREYVILSDPTNPFSKCKSRVKVKGSSDGWVSYAFYPYEGLFQSESMKEKQFLRLYELAV